jgi:hypothetical protein
MMPQGYQNSVPQQNPAPQMQPYQQSQAPQVNPATYNELPRPVGNAVELGSTPVHVPAPDPKSAELESPVGSPLPRYSQFGAGS